MSVKKKKTRLCKNVTRNNDSGGGRCNSKLQYRSKVSYHPRETRMTLEKLQVHGSNFSRDFNYPLLTIHVEKASEHRLVNMSAIQASSFFPEYRLCSKA